MAARQFRPFTPFPADGGESGDGKRGLCGRSLCDARLNEYRTTYEKPTFTILCKKDAKTTYNRVVPITEVDPGYFAKIQGSEDAAETARTLTPEIEALRNQLLSPSAASSSGARQAAPERAPAASSNNAVNEDPNDLTLDLETRTETPSTSTANPAPTH